MKINIEFPRKLLEVYNDACKPLCKKLKLPQTAFDILMFLGNPNIKTSLVTVFGFILLGAALISFGMFASSITENQVIAAIVSIEFYVITCIGTPYLRQS